MALNLSYRQQQSTRSWLRVSSTIVLSTALVFLASIAFQTWTNQPSGLSPLNHAGSRTLLQREISERLEAKADNTTLDYPVPTKTILYRRALSSDNAIATAQAAVCSMALADTAGALAATYTNQADLNRWEWNPDSAADTYGSNLDDAFSTLGVTAPKNIQAYHVQNEDAWKSDNPSDGQYLASYGSYTQYMNPTQGLLIAENNYSPKEMTPNPTDTIVPLSHWSDIVYLQWLWAGGTTAQLKVANGMIRYNIANTDTENMIALALGQSMSYRTWSAVPKFSQDGKTFSKGSTGFNLLLGTPHGNGVAHFLYEHKQQMGVREVSEITVFSTGKPNDGNSSPYICLYFKFDDVANPT